MLEQHAQLRQQGFDPATVVMVCSGSTASGTSAVGTFTQAVPIGSALLVATGTAGSGTGSQGSVADSVGNTYGSGGGNTIGRGGGWSTTQNVTTVAITTSTTMTVTWTPTAACGFVCLLVKPAASEVIPLNLGSLTGGGGSGGTGTAVTTLATSSATPAQDDSHYFAMLNTNAGTTAWAMTGATLLGTITTNICIITAVIPYVQKVSATHTWNWTTASGAQVAGIILQTRPQFAAISNRIVPVLRSSLM